MKKIIMLSLLSLSVVGCASTDYAVYADTQKKIAEARTASEVARYQALAEIAKTGDSASRVAAVISLNMQQSQSVSNVGVAAPTRLDDNLLRWMSVLVPAATQIYGIGKNADVAIANSISNASVARSTNESFVSIAGKIQAPGAVTTTTTNTTSTSSNTTNNTTTNTTTNTNSNNTNNNSNNSTDNTHTPTVVTQPAPVIVGP